MGGWGIVDQGRGVGQFGPNRWVAAGGHGQHQREVRRREAEDGADQLEGQFLGTAALSDGP